MAARKKRSSKRPTRRSPPPAPPEGLDDDVPPAPVAEFGLQTTGAQIVTFADTSRRSLRSALSTLRTRAGVASVCHMADFDRDSFDVAQTVDADAVMFDELGIAVVRGESERMAAVAGVQTRALADLIVEPEYVNHAFTGGLDDDLGHLSDAPEAGISAGAPASADYLRGYADGVAQLSVALRGSEAGAITGEGDPRATYFGDTTSATWGLHATRALRSRQSGHGIRIAVLDTGFDLAHPDFRGRNVTAQSFISGETAQDGNGHGTHCIGTACGPEAPGAGPRYGVAPDAIIFAGKVLGDAGSGSDSSILGGINWALRNGCEIVSMSLGRRVRPGETPMRSYETAGRRALRAGTLIVAAAGNDSARPYSMIPVSSPANAASIAAVAALDARLRVATFSNAGLNTGGGEINLAAPGVDVHSAWPMPLRLRSISGTSMATPHVAGLAALIAQESDDLRGVALYRELRRRARALRLSRQDVGHGLARAV